MADSKEKEYEEEQVDETTKFQDVDSFFNTATSSKQLIHEPTTNITVKIDTDHKSEEHMMENVTAVDIQSTNNKIMNALNLPFNTKPDTAHQLVDSRSPDSEVDDAKPLTRADMMANVEQFQVADDGVEHNIKKIKYQRKPCLRFLFNLIGWFIWCLCWFILLLFCIVFGPIIFIAIKSRYIWHNIIWESLIAHTLTEEDALYQFKNFPHSSFFKHAGPTYIQYNCNFIVIFLKILYVIPQGLVLGTYTIWWLLRANYILIKKENTHATQSDIMVKFANWVKGTPVGHTLRRTFSSFFFVLDVSTDIIIMIKLYNGQEKYWFSLTFGSILASYFVPWARSITFVKEYIVKSGDKRCRKRVLRNIAGLFLIPWFGIIIVFGFDVYIVINILFDWLRLLFAGRSRKETEEELSYRRLRTLTELLCESIPQLIIQWYILQSYKAAKEEEKIEELGLNEFDLYRSIGASGMNLCIQILSLYFESKQLMDDTTNMTFFQYMFISMEGKFGFSTKLISIASGAEFVDLSNIEFRSDPYLLSNFFQATSTAQQAMGKKKHQNVCQRVLISPQSVAGLENESILQLSKHCRRNRIELMIECDWHKWYISQLAYTYCLDVTHRKEPPYHTSLTYAVSLDGYDGYDYLQRLLDTHCDPNRPNRETDSPLLLSVALMKLDYTKLLLKYGAKVNELNSQDKTALFHGCARGEIGLIQTLLDHNIDVFQQDNELGNTCLVETGFTTSECVRVIIEHPNVKKQEEQRHEKFVNVENNKGETALFKAANFNKVEVVRMLIEHGSDINHQDANGDTSLHKTRSAQIVEFLIESGADVHIENNAKQTPVFYTVKHAVYTVIPNYKKHGIKEDHQDVNGNTIFHLLGEQRAWKFMVALMKYHGFTVPLHLKNKDNRSVMDMIQYDVENNRKDALEYIDYFVSQSQLQSKTSAE
eukprot:44844_1